MPVYLSVYIYLPESRVNLNPCAVSMALQVCTRCYLSVSKAAVVNDSKAILKYRVKAKPSLSR